MLAWQRHAALTLSAMLGGCAFSPNILQDPTYILGAGPDPSDVFKSLKCEVATFIVINKIRSDLVSSAKRHVEIAAKRGDEVGTDDDVNLIKSFPVIEIDSKQYAAIGVDLKNVNSFSAGFGLDYRKPALISKKPFNVARSRDLNFGVAYAEQNTYDFTQPYVLPQDIDLGSSRSFSPRGTYPPLAAAYSTIYNAPPKADQDFYCYGSLFRKKDSTSRLNAIADLQSLMDNDPNWAEYIQFKRIFVGGVTLAKWLQGTASDMVSNQNAVFATAEKMLPGQMNYSFTLDVKPSFDVGYNLVATLLNPITATAGGSIEHSSSFYIILNTIYAAGSQQAKSGNSCNRDRPGADCK